MVACMGFIGLLDDLRDLRPRWKALLGLAIAVVLSEVALRRMPAPPASTELLWFSLTLIPWVIFPLLVLMFWCLPQAFNLIDGADGLATGFGLVVVGSLWAAGSPHPALAGALLACMILNWPRPRLFLGDCGSLSVGLLLVIDSQKFLLPHDPNHLLWLFAYPTIDVLMVVSIRLANRRPVFYGDRNHLHYQIMDRWPAFSALAVPLLLVLAALCGSAVYLRGAWTRLPFLGLTLLMGLSCYFGITSVSRSLQNDEDESESILAKARRPLMRSSE